MDTLPALVADASALPATPFALALAAGEDLAQASKSPATRRAYGGRWRDFAAWCGANGRMPLPADVDTAVAYLAALARRGLTVSTIDGHAAAIAFFHRLHEHDSPLASEKVRAALQGIRNRLGSRPAKKEPLTVELLRKVLRRIRGDSLEALRDRALILLAFGSAVRRSELVALDVQDLRRERQGLLVHIGRSKGDQAGRGQEVAVPNGKLGIADAVFRWLDAAGITSGPVFRGVDRRVSDAALSDRQFARILKKRCAAAGLDPTAFSGHSTRSGFATSADEAGADLADISRQLRHAKLETTRGYIRTAELFRKNAGRGIL